MMIIQIISDTHCQHNCIDLPLRGDVLIHCGDFSSGGIQSTRDFLEWFEKQPYKHKIFIAGNHDWFFEKFPAHALDLVKTLAPSATYLQDSGCEIDGVKFWGSPVTPVFNNWAFSRGEDIVNHWNLIPAETDVLITHGPAFGCLDLGGERGRHLGCLRLSERLHISPPRLHCHGHIHESYGAVLAYYGSKTTNVVNASICDSSYRPVNYSLQTEITCKPKKRISRN